jgi:nicotinate-nucleotide pyrophosphorylase (carboxylating)
MSFSPEESAACDRLVELALAEDLNSAGDLTGQAVIPADFEASTVFVARAAGVVAGLPAAALVAHRFDPRLRFAPTVADGAAVSACAQLATLSGPMQSILAAERTALNFLQHLSGIATLTRRFIDAIAGLPCKILDTRKTLPGWRSLAKYAVRQGGGCNHRMGLYDGILIKDNHLAALRVALKDAAGEVQSALANAAVYVSAFPKLETEIEVEDLAKLEQALACRPNIVLLDNMNLDQLRQAVKIRDAQALGILLEASGGVNLSTVRAIAETGVDRISVGALTHSAPALDIALDYCF